MTVAPAQPRPSATELLAPAALAKVARMELVAKQVMDGYVQGMHRSPHIGFALDFAQHRQYVPGDDVKRIDWRAYAKADRYYIKQYEVMTSLRAHLVLDCSGSMAYRGKHDAMSKFRYGQYLAACLAYLVLHQQDAAGLVTFDKTIRQFIPARSAASHLLALVRALDATEPGGESAIAPLLHQVAERITKRGMVIVISDFFDTPAAIIEALHHLRHKRHEVLLLHVMADDELTFPFRKWGLFESLEIPGQRIKVDPATTRARYLKRVQEHQDALRDGASKLNILYKLLNTKNPFDTALTEFLASRMGRR